MYPMWAKYWAFQGMLKLGTYDAGHETYQRRSAKTTHPFVEANPTVIAACILAMMNYVKYKKVPEGENLEEPLKSGSFKKLYEYYSKKFQKTKAVNSGIEGIWVKYNYKNEDDAKRLFDSLQGKGTGWCTEADAGYAKSQVCGGNNYEGGDFYVYYTADQDGKMTIPRIAIRMNGTDRIGEIRGIEENQNLETDMIPILEQKLKEMTFVSDKSRNAFLDITNRLKLLTVIYKKTVKKEQLSSDMINTLYEKNIGFGWEPDPMFGKVIALRDFESDFHVATSDKAKEKIAKLFFENSRHGRFSSDRFKRYKEITLFAIRSDERFIYYIPSELFSNKEFVLEALEYNSAIYKRLSDELKKDKDIILKSLKGGIDYINVPEEQRKDKDIAIVAIKSNSFAYNYIDESLKDDKEIVLLTLDGRYNIYDDLSSELKKDKDVCLLVLSFFSYEYNNMPIEIREDREFVKMAIISNVELYEHISDRLKKDKELAEIVLTEKPWHYRYLPDELKVDKEFIYKMIEIDPSIYAEARAIFSKEEKIRLIRKYPEIVEHLADEDIYDRDILAVAIEVRPEDFREMYAEMRFSTDFDETYTEETYKAELYFKSVYDEVMGRKKFKDIPEKEESKEEKPVSVVVQNMEPEEDPGMKL